MKWRHVKTVGNIAAYTCAPEGSKVTFEVGVEFSPTASPIRASLSWEWPDGKRPARDGLIYTHKHQPDHLAGILRMVGWRRKHSTPTEATSDLAP